MSILKEFKYPIIQGGMANISNAEFAAVVTKNGGLGVIGTGGWNKEKVEEEILLMKKLVADRSFGVNVMLMNPAADDIIDLCIKHKVKYITTGAGSPGKYIKKLREHNIKILPVVASVAMAKRMEKLGVDALIVEGTESGGHVGELTSMALIPQVYKAVNIDIIAAGGIGSNRQFLAALALGACGAQIGTMLLATKECPIHDNYKAALIKARDTSTVVTGRVKGVPVRNLKNKMTREYQRLESTDISLEDLEYLTLGSLSKAVKAGDVEEGSFMAGQVAGQIDQISTIAELFASITDYKAILNDIKEFDNESS